MLGSSSISAGVVEPAHILERARRMLAARDVARVGLEDTRELDAWIVAQGQQLAVGMAVFGAVLSDA